MITLIRSVKQALLFVLSVVMLDVVMLRVVMPILSLNELRFLLIRQKGQLKNIVFSCRQGDQMIWKKMAQLFEKWPKQPK
jgi:hypothetical protein